MIQFLTDLPDQLITLVGAAGERGRSFNKSQPCEVGICLCFYCTQIDCVLKHKQSCE